VEKDLQKRVRIPLFYSWPMIFHSINRLLERGGDNCGIFNIMGVLSNGSLAMCGIGMEIPELTYGKLGVDQVEDVWINNLVLKDIRRELPANLEDPCGRCLFKRQCLGSCVAENYHQARRLTAPFWFCQQAKDKGLLPEQRTQ
jgi:radical SAM protein with 4Fe4S-binding SPASM domain